MPQDRSTIKLTVAQAIILYLKNQWIGNENSEHPFFAGMWGIFGHGNVGGLGQALEENPDFTYYQARNEQGMVHAAIAYAKQLRRKQAIACTSSIGPGATNMLTGAALATINRIPLLLLPGDIFAKRQQGPVLQQLENSQSMDISVNDCFRPISRYFDRIYRPEQLEPALRETMRVLLSPSDTGTVTLSLPQDVQTESFDFPTRLFSKVIHVYPAYPPNQHELHSCLKLISRAKKPLIICGGGVKYAEAEQELLEFLDLTSIPLAETQAGKGAIPFSHPMNLGAIGVTGTQAANSYAQSADLIIAMGTRLSDFTTASETQFPNAGLGYVSLNCNSFDGHKYLSTPLIGDLKLSLQSLNSAIIEDKEKFQKRHLVKEIGILQSMWHETRNSITSTQDINESQLPTQAQVIGILNDFMSKEDTIICAAGGLPGDLHKLFHAQNSDQYHIEYGYSCMGYEIAGGLGAKMAKPSGEVYILVGDGSYLMMHQELITSLQENYKLIVIVVNNGQFKCIDNLSKSLGSKGFGNSFNTRDPISNSLSGELLNIDYQQNAQSLGLLSEKCTSIKKLKETLFQAKEANKSFLMEVLVNKESDVPGFKTRWNVPVAEISTSPSVQAAHQAYEAAFK